MPSFTLGQPEADHITIQMEELRYGHYSRFELKIEIRTGGFGADYAVVVPQYKIGFLVQRIVKLQDDLHALFNELSGSVHFVLLERQLEFELTGDGLGHFKLRGTAIDRIGGDNHLSFGFEFDQTFLPATLSALEILTRRLH